MSDHDRVLVAYGSKHGATAEIAQAIGGVLGEAGLDVDVRRAGEVHSLEPYRAVVLGSAVYAGRWRPDAFRLLRRPELRELDVWLFSSGPVGEDARDSEEVERLTRPARVEALGAGHGVHEHVVFGGKVAEDAGFIRKRIARRTPAAFRDRRDWNAIADWAERIAAAVMSTV